MSDSEEYRIDTVPVRAVAADIAERIQRRAIGGWIGRSIHAALSGRYAPERLAPSGVTDLLIALALAVEAEIEHRSE